MKNLTKAVAPAIPVAIAIVLELAGVHHVTLIFALVGAYFLPTIVAAARKVPNQGSVLVINLFLGWTFIGWVVALAMAVRSRLTVDAKVAR